MTSEDMVEDPLMTRLKIRFYCKRRSKSVFLKRQQSLKLNHDRNYLMKSEDTVEDPLMGVQFYVKNKSFSFRVTVHLLFSFLLQKTPKSVFLPRYGSLALNHDTD